MGYRDSSQALEEPIDKILSGIKEFDKAIDKRVDSGEWERSHIKEISEISIKLRKIKLKLIKIKSETW